MPVARSPQPGARDDRHGGGELPDLQRGVLVGQRRASPAAEQLRRTSARRRRRRRAARTGRGGAGAPGPGVGTPGTGRRSAGELGGVRERVERVDERDEGPRHRQVGRRRAGGSPNWVPKLARGGPRLKNRAVPTSVGEEVDRALVHCVGGRPRRERDREEDRRLDDRDRPDAHGAVAQREERREQQPGRDRQDEQLGLAHRRRRDRPRRVDGGGCERHARASSTRADDEHARRERDHRLGARRGREVAQRERGEQDQGELPGRREVARELDVLDDRAASASSWRSPGSPTVSARLSPTHAASTMRRPRSRRPNSDATARASSAKPA